MKKIIVVLLKIGVSAAIVGYLVWDAHQNEAFANLRQQAKNWGMLAGALIVCASAVMLTLIRWCYLVRALNLPFAIRDALRLGLLGYLFNLAPMGIVGGDLLKAVMLARQQKDHRAEALASVFVDRAVGLYTLFVVASVAILATGFPGQGVGEEEILWVSKAALLVTGIATLLVVAVLMPDLTHGKSTRWLGKIPSLGPPLLRLVDAVQMYRRKLPVLAAAAVMSVGVHSLFTLGIFLIASGLYQDVPALGVHFVLSPLSAATGMLPLPMGPFEFVLDRLYPYAPLAGGGAMKPGQGLVIALGYRIITVLIAAVGICYYLGSREELAEVLHEAEQEDEQEQTDRPFTV